ncbi:MAG: hypothetical protein HYS12_03460 [Planctomycetes bacterium]|nr:hypothetical protein [Planctomycetota bacterium]
MQFQIDVSSTASRRAADASPAVPGSAETIDLLRQILEVQREQLAYQKAALQAHDAAARWRSFLSRWKEDFPGLSDACRRVLPTLERCYGQLNVELTSNLNDQGCDALDTDFALQEFLDRYGMRLAQLGTILNLVGLLADAGTPGEPS